MRGTGKVNKIILLAERKARMATYMEVHDNIFGCFVSYPPVLNDATDEQRLDAREYGELFRGYIWGVNGISNCLKNLRHEDYGKDIKLALFQFHIHPMAIEIPNLKAIEPYRKKEKSIGMPIIITHENFFERTEWERYCFIQQSLLHKVDLLRNVARKRRLDTRVRQLKSDLQKVLCQYQRDIWNGKWKKRNALVSDGDNEYGNDKTVL